MASNKGRKSVGFEDGMSVELIAAKSNVTVDYVKTVLEKWTHDSVPRDQYSEITFINDSVSVSVSE